MVVGQALSPPEPLLLPQAVQAPVVAEQTGVAPEQSAAEQERHTWLVMSQIGVPTAPVQSVSVLHPQESPFAPPAMHTGAVPLQVT